MKIYTKTGDKGQTCLVGGSRINKNSIRLEAYGTVDELNSYIGLLRSYPLQAEDSELLIDIQNTLFAIGSELATPYDKTSDNPRYYLTDKMEQAIDRITEQLPQMTHFILPGGGVSTSFAHIARTVCRRTERRILDLNDVEPVSVDIISYINRLSDYLFTLARKFAYDEKIPEVKWIP
ncbi:MAG: cob(I)yrinic acid a,c-diamide adenosyltransferase [Marinifilaceae bacterium]